jgi:hypothetical protein
MCFYTNSQKCDNTSVNYKPNPVRVLKAQNGYTIRSSGEVGEMAK